MKNESESTVQFPASTELRRQLEEKAAAMNLTLGAYITFLMARQNSSVGPRRFDRMAREVFGRYGRAMRNLAK